MPPLNLNTTGETFWRSLDELADTQEFREFLATEFPNYSTAEMLLGSSSRRHFLKIMGASLALGGLVGCRRWPEQKIAPYATRPGGQTPGEPEYYATAMEVGGVAKPLLVNSFDGRPIKVEGNPDHPACSGAADIFAQASVLGVYDPERSRRPTKLGGEGRVDSTWEEFDAFAGEHFGQFAANQGRGLAVLCESTASPSVAAAKKRFQEQYPEALWAEYEPISWQSQVEGARLAFGRPLRTHLHLDEATVIVSLEADLLGAHPDSLRLARDWAKGRRAADEGRMSRMYVAEGGYSLTGANADSRLAIRPSRIAEVARAIQRHLQGETHGAAPDIAAFAATVAEDLRAHQGRSVVVAGANQPAEVHALCFAINDALQSIGKTVSFTEPLADVPGPQTLSDLTSALNAGSVETLVVLGGNPAYTAPADLDFQAALARVATSVHLSQHENETSLLCSWHVPQAHYLEAWGDARTWDGTISVIQPLIQPLYRGRSMIELLAAVMGESQRNGYDIVRETFRTLVSGDFEEKWRRVLHDGLLEGSQLQPVRPALGYQPEDSPAAPASGYDVVFLPDSKVYDGRFANNGWLQELPDSLTMVTWDNAAHIGPATAAELGVETGDMISVTVGGRTLEIAVFVLPGVAPKTIALTLGYGRTAAGHVGSLVGFDTYALRTSTALGIASGAQVAKTGSTYEVVTTQNHHAVSGEMIREMYNQRIGDLLREADLETYRKKPRFATMKDHGDLELQLFPDPVNYEEGHNWGMTIDLTSCIGCSACVIACQAENNIPIVGKEQVSRSREMHWIRVDRYFKGEPETPRVAHQPVTCHHCENAPCEQVCPVAATVHDTEGLNVMIYNRCIGTRYCSNNCPYKVRRFNYFDWHTRDARSDINDTMPHVGMPDTEHEDVNPLLQMQFNPEVTVRMRGVMEKCTYCTQRIQAAKITAKNEHAQGKRDTFRVQDGEITPACAQTCPTQAIVFGDLNDPESRVRKLHEHNRSYAMLAKLNVRPRTKYLAKVWNPAPAPASMNHGAEA